MKYLLTAYKVFKNIPLYESITFFYQLVDKNWQLLSKRQIQIAGMAEQLGMSWFTRAFLIKSSEQNQGYLLNKRLLQLSLVLLKYKNVEFLRNKNSKVSCKSQDFHTTPLAINTELTTISSQNLTKQLFKYFCLKTSFQLNIPCYPRECLKQVPNPILEFFLIGKTFIGNNAIKWLPGFNQ
jgi:hypothetical protein